MQAGVGGIGRGRRPGEKLLYGSKDVWTASSTTSTSSHSLNTAAGAAGAALAAAAPAGAAPMTGNTTILGPSTSTGTTTTGTTTGTTRDPNDDAVKEFHRCSRLHFLGTWRERFERWRLT